MRKMLIAFMTLAFFFLVIGDLILIHQRVLFHYDDFTGQPLSKPDKTAKEKVYKLKDKKDRVLINFLSFLSEIQKLHNGEIFCSGIIAEYPCCFQYIRDAQFSLITYRGPPVLS